MTKKIDNQYGDTCEIIPRRVSNFLNTDVLGFARYVIETRAIPNLMDGLRVGARKIIYAALTGDMKKGTNVKVPSLIGDTLKLEYHHGDASLLNTIVQLSSTYKFFCAPFEINGQIGSLRVPDCDTAPRYLHVKYSKFIDLFKVDNELMKPIVENGKKLEPKFFLPIIPVMLLQRTNSPGFGFSYRGFSFSFDDVIDACIQTIINGSCTGLYYIPLRPEIEGINPDLIIYNENKQLYFNIGEYQLDLDKDLLVVTDLPFNVTYKSFEERLDKLKETNYIADFSNQSRNGKIKYVIRFYKGRLKTLYKEKWKFYKNFLLYIKIPKLTLNALDQNGKTIINFDTPQDLVNTFVSKRLVYYILRKTKTIDIIKEKIIDLTNKAKFIKLVIDGDLVINKRLEEDILIDLQKHNLPSEVLKLSISRLTKNEIDKSLKEIDELKEQLQYIIGTTPENMYLKDLIDLKYKYCSIENKVNNNITNKNDILVI